MNVVINCVLAFLGLGWLINGSVQQVLSITEKRYDKPFVAFSYNRAKEHSRFMWLNFALGIPTVMVLIVRLS